MQNKYNLSDGTVIIIETDFLGEGGEGVVFEVISPQKFRSSVAKILLNQNRVLARRDKVSYMINNPPLETKDQTGHSFLIWPEHLLFDKNEFAGFLMPKAEGVTLEELSSTELGYYPYPRHNEKLGHEWLRFERNNSDSLILRLKLCSNIAIAIQTLHSSGNYIIGDLKPQNIMVLPNGKVSILDLDSCQITKGGDILFESKMNTAEFNPPEKYQNKKEKSWDLFILGIIFYKLLSGVHPYFGTCKAPYQNCTLPELKIKEGLFPHGSKKQYFEVIPIGHDIFKNFPEFVQKLFINCFDDGTENPDLRPSSLDWINKLTAKPYVKYFKSDQDVIFDTKKFNLHWDSENGRRAEIEEFGEVDLNGTLSLTGGGKSFFKLKIYNEFGETVQPLSITRFPTPIIETIFVPVPDLNFKISILNISISSPNLEISVRFNEKKMSIPPIFTDADDILVKAKPSLKKRKFLNNFF